MSDNWISGFTKESFKAYASTMSAFAGVRPFVYADGRVRGMRGIDGWTGAGLRFTLWPDRALDIGPVWFKDKPVSWIYPALGAPNHYEAVEDGWLRTFGGGLMVTCGLTHFGASDHYKGINNSLHGRVGHLPAENCRIWQEWREEDYVLIVEGEIHQSVLFGENLVLRRRIETALGSQTLTVKDSVRNEGSREIPHALLYHCNLGFPLVSPTSGLIFDDKNVEPRDKAARMGLENFASFETPQPGYAEQVFFHVPKISPDGFSTVSLFNPDLNFGIRLDWLAESMPILTQWKMMGQGEYVCGLEPATHAMGPRKDLAKKGLPRPLAPGEQVDYELRLTIIDNI